MDFLRSIGIQEWILDGDENFTEFTKWITSNISTENIVTDADILA